jgi:hypothetical protein
MAINVYWASIEKEWMLAKPLDSVASTFYKKDLIDPNNRNSQINYCPAFNNHLKNVYAMRSLYNYELYLDNGNLHSKDYDQEFYDDHVLIRSYEKRFFSFKNSYIFFTDEPSLKTTFYEFPCFEDNNITKRCIPVPGQFDIGKWFRGTEFAFYLKDGFNSFKIEQDEIYSYVRFHTDQKINFIEFNYSDKLKQFNQERFDAISKVPRLKTLENYYKMLRHKKLILKEIRDNII